MKTLHNPVIIGVISSVIIGGVIFVMFQTIVSGPLDTPNHNNWKIYQTAPVFEELRNITGIATIKNQTYYFTTLNDTMITYHQNPLQMSFHDVVFTFFPSPPYMGPVGMCGGFTLGADAKFSDGIHELLRVPVLDMACAQNYTNTDLSNHTNPQAGLTVYEGKVKLLVSTENISQQNIVNISNLIPVTNTNFTINYTITEDSKLLDIILDSKAKELLLSLQAPNNGTLTVTVPRALLDAKIHNQDDMFIVLIDGTEVSYTETKTIAERTLIIPFDHSATKIEIIATQLI